MSRELRVCPVDGRPLATLYEDCPGCGLPLIPVPTRWQHNELCPLADRLVVTLRPALYCSTRCRMAAYRQRVAARGHVHA